MRINTDNMSIEGGHFSSFLTKKEGQKFDAETVRLLCEVSATQMFFDVMRHYREQIKRSIEITGEDIRVVQNLIDKAGNKLSNLSKNLGIAARVEPEKEHELFFYKAIAEDFVDFIKKGMATDICPIDIISKYIPDGTSSYEEVRINMLRKSAPKESLSALDEILLQYQL